MVDLEELMRLQKKREATVLRFQVDTSDRQLVMYAEKKSQKDAWIRALKSLSNVTTAPQFGVKDVSRSTKIELGKLVPRNDEKDRPPVLSADLTPSPAVTSEPGKVKPKLSIDVDDGDEPVGTAMPPLMSPVIATTQRGTFVFTIPSRLL